MPTIFRRPYRDRHGVTKRTTKFYGKWTDASGAVHCKPLSADRPTAERMLAELIRRDDFARHGLPSPAPESAAGIAEQLVDYAAYLAARGSTPKHIAKQIARIERVVEAAGITQPERITEHAVTTGIGRIRLGYSTTGRGAKAVAVGAKTARYYLVAIRGFTRWLHLRAKRLPNDPLAGAELGGDTAKGRRMTPSLRRRSLTGPEFQRLLKTTEASAATFRGLDGSARAALYLTALHTGFRAGELASLTRASLSLAADPPTITVSHGGRSATQTVRPDVAARLIRWVESDGPRTLKAQLWPGGWVGVAAEMLRLDLAAAGIPHTTPEGRIDFHALRGSLATLLIAAGNDPKTVQSVMRHSQISLTMDLYARARQTANAAALESLPALSDTEVDTESANKDRQKPPMLPKAKHRD